MSPSVPEPTASHTRADWENAQPLGIYQPLNTRLAQGQLASQLQFIQPLGTRSLSVLQPQLFSSDPTFVSEAIGQSFDDFPFFENPTDPPAVDPREVRTLEQPPAPRLQQAAEVTATATATAEPEAVAASRSPLPPAIHPPPSVEPSISESLQSTADAISRDAADPISEGPDFSAPEDNTPLIHPSTDSPTPASSAQALPENVEQEVAPATQPLLPRKPFAAPAPVTAPGNPAEPVTAPSQRSDVPASHELSEPAISQPEIAASSRPEIARSSDEGARAPGHVPLPTTPDISGIAPPAADASPPAEPASATPAPPFAEEDDPAFPTDNTPDVAPSIRQRAPSQASEPTPVTLLGNRQDPPPTAAAIATSSDQPPVAEAAPLPATESDTPAVETMSPSASDSGPLSEDAIAPPAPPDTPQAMTPASTSPLSETDDLPEIQRQPPAPTASAITAAEASWPGALPESGAPTTPVESPEAIAGPTNSTESLPHSTEPLTTQSEPSLPGVVEGGLQESAPTPVYESDYESETPFSETASSIETEILPRQGRSEASSHAADGLSSESAAALTPPSESPMTSPADAIVPDQNSLEQLPSDSEDVAAEAAAETVQTTAPPGEGPVSAILQPQPLSATADRPAAASGEASATELRPTTEAPVEAPVEAPDIEIRQSQSLPEVSPLAPDPISEGPPPSAAATDSAPIEQSATIPEPSSLSPASPDLPEPPTALQASPLPDGGTADAAAQISLNPRSETIARTVSDPLRELPPQSLADPSLPAADVSTAAAAEPTQEPAIPVEPPAEPSPAAAEADIAAEPAAELRPMTEASTKTSLEPSTAEVLQPQRLPNVSTPIADDVPTVSASEFVRTKESPSPTKSETLQAKSIPAASPDSRNPVVRSTSASEGLPPQRLSVPSLPPSDAIAAESATALRPMTEASTKTSIEPSTAEVLQPQRLPDVSAPIADDAPAMPAPESMQVTEVSTEASRESSASQLLPSPNISEVSPEVSDDFPIAPSAELPQITEPPVASRVADPLPPQSLPEASPKQPATVPEGTTEAEPMSPLTAELPARDREWPPPASPANPQATRVDAASLSPVQDELAVQRQVQPASAADLSSMNVSDGPPIAEASTSLLGEAIVPSAPPTDTQETGTGIASPGALPPDTTAAITAQPPLQSPSPEARKPDSTSSLPSHELVEPLGTFAAERVQRSAEAEVSRPSAYQVAGEPAASPPIDIPQAESLGRSPASPAWPSLESASESAAAFPPTPEHPPDTADAVLPRTPEPDSSVSPETSSASPLTPAPEPPGASAFDHALAENGERLQASLEASNPAIASPTSLENSPATSPATAPTTAPAPGAETSEAPPIQRVANRETATPELPPAAEASITTPSIQRRSDLDAVASEPTAPHPSQPSSRAENRPLLAGEPDPQSIAESTTPTDSDVRQPQHLPEASQMAAGETSIPREATSSEGPPAPENAPAPQPAPNETATAHAPMASEGLPPQETPAASYTALGETVTVQASSPAEERLQPQKLGPSSDLPVNAPSPESSADELTHDSFQDHTVPESPRAAIETSALQPSVESLSGQSAPPLVEAPAIAPAMERPFLSGNQAIQRSVALPQVTQDLGVYSPLRSPLALNSLAPAISETMPMREKVPVEGVPVASVSGASASDPAVAVDSSVSDVLSTGSFSEDSSSLRQTPSLLASDDETSDADEVQRQPLEDASRGPNPLVESQSSPPPEAASTSASATPQVWDSIADLLAQSMPAQTVQASPQAAPPRPDRSTTSPTSPPALAVPAVAPAIAAPDPFPNLHALENLPSRIQPQTNGATHASLAPTIVQRFTTDDDRSLAESSPMTVTAEDTPENASERLETLAQVMYHMVRQRLAVERERLGRFGPGRFQ